MIISLVASPSSTPTTAPSPSPPTLTPSAPPTLAFGANYPTVVPTLAPSPTPTFVPTNPTGQPSSQPSTQPTSKPSTHPSRQPSTQPSSHPTTKPSSSPTLNDAHETALVYEGGASKGVGDISNLQYIVTNTFTNLGHSFDAASPARLAATDADPTSSNKTWYLSVDVWQTGFGGTVSYQVMDTQVLNSSTGLMQSLFSASVGGCSPGQGCFNGYVRCLTNVDVTAYVSSRLGGSLIVSSFTSGVLTVAPKCLHNGNVLFVRYTLSCLNTQPTFAPSLAPAIPSNPVAGAASLNVLVTSGALVTVVYRSKTQVSGSMQ